MAFVAKLAIGFIGLSPANYNIVVKDNNGCTASTMQTITEPDSLQHR